MQTYNCKDTLQLLAVSILLFPAIAYAGSSECIGVDGTQYFYCKYNECALGDIVLSTSTADHPDCPGTSEKCPDIRGLGWVKGHKTNFCLDKGFGAHIAAAECHSGKNYRDGGWCVEKGALDHCKEILKCK